ncbi:SRPBCC family protein [Variovorax sp. Sphag1AA]|uniref:SRPBCC family protein n=1 Tax=Variovorax sp. Sphag1AA TaxID=2587027 RepID=UPI00161A0CA1|nr:SRPBCC family protein [Variovorax sp. Sphag1AA]MBB3181847.1 ribosome-associated toxin RatA of RatAB toxin-antitoxin module [Variovorax sp. Sphag1AA]
MLAGALCAPAAASVPQVEIQTNGQGDDITVTASAEMLVDPHTAWAVITDYNHLAEFIPYMLSSRVVQRDADRVVIEQTGVFSFLFYRQPVQAQLSVVESPPRRVIARAVGGNLREMEGHYTLEKLPTGTVRLSYSARLVPDFAVPPVIGKVVVRTVLANQFSAMVKEIERRDAEKGR